MNYIVSLVVGVSCISTTLSHMSMQFPYPRDLLNGASYAVWQQNEPMWAVHPDTCHGLDADTTVRSGNTFAAGQLVEIDIYGSAPHDGGHCAFWWTDDTSGDWYKIIDVKDCTLADSFYVMMPYTMATSCSTLCTFAFTWVPVSSGACEIYMNCAEVQVTGTTGVVDSEKITLNFDTLVSGDNCERVDDSTHWTTIFSTLKEDYTDSDTNGGDAATDPNTADTSDVITVDDTQISDDIEDDTSELCVNPDATNLDGDIQNDGTCGSTCDNCRCDDGQCCSEHGFCGPEFVGYDDQTGDALYWDYDNNDYFSSETEAYAAYCDNNQGDWRLVSCTNSTSGSSSSGDSDGGNNDSGDSDNGDTGSDVTPGSGACSIANMVGGIVFTLFASLFV